MRPHPRIRLAAASIAALAMMTPGTASASAPGSYVVVLADGAGVASVSDLAGELAARHGGSVRHVYTAALRGFAVRLPAARAAALAADPRVARVQPDVTAEVTDTQTNAPWNLDRVDQRSLPLNSAFTYQSTGSGVPVYVLDTGIRTTHTTFGGRAKHAYDAVDNDFTATDCNGHGTHVAGTVAGSTWGSAKAATVHAVRVLPCDGSGPNSTVIAALDWMVRTVTTRPAVINMSLRSPADPALDSAVRAAIDSGFTVVAAAGNDNRDACGYSPGRVPEVITVGNSTRADERWTTSNYGACLDLFAPGREITSASHTSDTGTTVKTGTSMASPLVAGVVAQHLAGSPGATPAQVHATVVGCSTPGKITGAGSGSPNRLLFTPCGAADFSVAVSPSSVGVAPGASATATVTVTGVNGFASATTLSASGLPAGVRAAFSPNPATPGTAATMTVTADATAATGTYPVTVTGTSGALTRSASIQVVVGGSAGFADDFEANRGWVVNAAGTDTATAGQFAVGDPEQTTSTYSNQVKQLGTTPSGVACLVTGRAAGTAYGANDLDGGVTSARSPLFTVPSAAPRLTFAYSYAHGDNATSADYLRVKVVDGTTATTVFDQRGSAVERAGLWQNATVDLTAFAGRSVRLLVESADADTASLWEAQIDDVRVS